MSRSEDTEKIAALPYHEPDITTILILTSFLLLLNTVNHVMDRVVYVGLLGQIFLGIAFGTPGGNILGHDVEGVVVDLGYLGLLLLVYEGGLSTSFRSVKANLSLSAAVAATGIAVPVAFSFILMKLAAATPLQAFAAGAALCSTSLGTTFTVMQTCGLSTTRMGVVLTSAAMMDDVIGLVMVQVISNLGSSASFSTVTVVRPIFVSIGFGVAVVCTCRYVVLPLMKHFTKWRKKHTESVLSRAFSTVEGACIIHVMILVAMITGSTYAGTSNLFAAYLTGAAISWWDDEAILPEKLPPGTMRHGVTLKRNCKQSRASSRQPQIDETHTSTIYSHGQQSRESLALISNTGIATFEKYFQQPLQRILRPFFFASIGFSIPITRMFTGSIIWRGFIYTILMVLGKAACGVWLVRWNFAAMFGCFSSVKSASRSAVDKEQSTPDELKDGTTDGTASTPQVANTAVKVHASSRTPHTRQNPNKPVSLYPPVIIGCAMVARGEIGFLISSVAEANKIFGDEDNGPIFLVVTWAVMLCTILGPIMVGVTVKRLNRVNQGKGSEHQARFLGVWGVEG